MATRSLGLASKGVWLLAVAALAGWGLADPAARTLRSTQAEPPAGEQVAQLDEGLRSRDGVVNTRLLPVTPGLPRGQRWKMGIEAEDMPNGVRITHVYNDTPASRAGIEAGDYIVTVNGYQVGLVQGQLFDAAEEFQRRADNRGFVYLLIWNRRDGTLANRTVRLERNLRGIDRPNRAGTVTGTVTYQERLALSRSAVMEVRLVDSSSRTLPVVLADATFANPGRPPLTFSIDYEQADVDPRATYVVEAQIWDRGRLLMFSRTPAPGIVRGRLVNDVEVLVEPIR